jgi:hypothetical protein
MHTKKHANNMNFHENMSETKCSRSHNFSCFTKLENCLLQKECKHGPERTISGSKFSNIAAILTVNILKNRNIASIFFKNRNKAPGFFTVEKINILVSMTRVIHYICNIKIKDFLRGQYVIYGPVRIILTS